MRFDIPEPLKQEHAALHDELHRATQAPAKWAKPPGSLPV